MELLTQASIHLFDVRLPTCVVKENVMSAYKSELGAGDKGKGQEARARGRWRWQEIKRSVYEGKVPGELLAGHYFSCLP